MSIFVPEGNEWLVQSLLSSLSSGVPRSRAALSRGEVVGAVCAVLVVQRSVPVFPF